MMGLAVERLQGGICLVKRFKVTVDGVPYQVEVEDVPGMVPAAPPDEPLAAAATAAPPPSAPAAPTARPVAEGEQVAAPLPGVVLELRVVEGDRVEAGEVLLILEAMKMENEVTAPVAGTVREVRVDRGSAVNVGDVLVVLRP
jgi:glutaconyl-CoA decarboxylase